MTAVLAAGLGWAALVLVQASAGWPEAGGAFHSLLAAWAQGPDGSWGGVLTQAARVLAAAGLVLGALAAALGTGDAASPLIGRRRLPLALSLPLGLALLSAATAGLGLAGAMTPGVLRGLALAACLNGFRAIRARGPELAAAGRSFASEPVSTAVACLLAAALWLALATLPDSHEDALVYHWAAPEAFLRAHRIHAAVQHFQWHGPLGVEMLFALGLAVAGVAGLKAVNLALLAAAVAGAGALARRLDPRARGWTAVALLALAPALVRYVWMAKNDLGAVVYWTAAALSMLAGSAGSGRGAQRSTRRAALLAGLFAGACAATKYTAIFPLAGLVAWFVLHRPSPRTILLAVLSAAATAAVWPARDWLVTRDPFYPLGPSSLHGLFWSPEYTDWLHRYAEQVTPVLTERPSYWLLAWRDSLADPAQFGIALAALAPLGLVAFLPGGAGLACAVALLVFLALLGERSTRFLLALAPLLAAGGELALLALRSARPRLAAAAWLVLVAAGAVHLAVGTALELPGDDWGFLAGRLHGPKFFARRYTAEEELRAWCADRCPASERILLTGSDRRFGFRQPVVSAHPVTMPLPWRWAKESWTPGELAKKWRQAGIGCIAHNLVSGRYRHEAWFPWPAWDDRALGVYRAFARRYLVEVHRTPYLDALNGLFYVLRVDRRPHPAAATVPVLPWTESLFARANQTARRSFLRDESLALTRDALARLPDVNDAMEQAATLYHQLGRLDLALALNRALARDGFNGETGWYELAVEESYAGRRAPAFAALRHRSRYAAYFSEDTDTLVAGLFLNWAEARARAGDSAGACRLLGILFRTAPGHGPATALARRLRCAGSGAP
ncbi:MAG: hypothetical protein AAB152_11810 [Candidatus Coatesbacteria bacterium]